MPWTEICVIITQRRPTNQVISSSI